ncbi:MAG TPA: 5'-3' exonuclease H3TH domain-containing protein [Tissierellaceae bacterium]|nr:5'-3' exonuclease H3TH domain-containing protein [Tissierellaceae bacterium]
MKNTEIKKNNILIVDGTNLIFRNYFVHTYRKTKAGIHTGGLYGTIRSLQSYINNFNPKQVFICFDKSSKTFRNNIYSKYKATRKKTDEELKNQFPLLKEYCKLVNMPFISIDMYEADDIIGSLSCKAKEYNLNPYAITGDKDLLQLIDKGVDVLYLSNKFGPIIYKEEYFIEEYNIKPSQFLDYKALVGDQSDNIPGVPGVGKITAAKLLGLYHSLDGIYQNLDKLKGKQKENVRENKDMAYISKELSEIIYDMELDYDKYFGSYIEEGFDLANIKAKEFLKGLEISNL